MVWIVHVSDRTLAVSSWWLSEILPKAIAVRMRESCTLVNAVRDRHKGRVSTAAPSTKKSLVVVVAAAVETVVPWAKKYNTKSNRRCNGIDCYPRGEKGAWHCCEIMVSVILLQSKAQTTTSLPHFCVVLRRAFSHKPHSEIRSSHLFSSP